jgi:NAD(P)-dependent dehydrogenase (short-subunit alcohol dehydrogenase family)
VGTVRDTSKVADLTDRYLQQFRAELLDVTETQAVHEVVDRSFAKAGRIDVIVSNAGYGLFGAAEKLTDAQVDHMVATNLVGSIQLIRSALPHLRSSISPQGRRSGSARMCKPLLANIHRPSAFAGRAASDDRHAHEDGCYRRPVLGSGWVRPATGSAERYFLQGQRDRPTRTFWARRCIGGRSRVSWGVVRLLYFAAVLRNRILVCSGAPSG